MFVVRIYLYGTTFYILGWTLQRKDVSMHIKMTIQNPNLDVKIVLPNLEPHLIDVGV